MGGNTIAVEGVPVISLLEANWSDRVIRPIVKKKVYRAKLTSHVESLTKTVFWFVFVNFDKWGYSFYLVS